MVDYEAKPTKKEIISLYMPHHYYSNMRFLPQPYMNSSNIASAIARITESFKKGVKKLC